MKSSFWKFFPWIICLVPFWPAFGQSINAGGVVLEEALRRKQLLGELDSSISFNIRPLRMSHLTDKRVFDDFDFFKPGRNEGKIRSEQTKGVFSLLPIRNTLAFNSSRPYGWGNSLMVPNVGLQNYLTGGVHYQYGPVQIQLQPEIVVAQNKDYRGFPDNFSPQINRLRFRYWNNGDSPERFGEGILARAALGQSKVSVNTGAFELGVSTENIWWGPGQFNALIFSNNAQGFPHLSINTIRPAQTLFGSFEGQLVIGKLEDSQLEPSQHPELNERYFREFSGDWRYLNGISITYQPKWVAGLFLGASRTFQSYNGRRGSSFADWFPVFNNITKKAAGLDLVGESDRGRDQQITVFSRYLFIQGKGELYFEYGRRDHAYNWREFLLNPEHARAFLFGFNKLIDLPKTNTVIQVRGEITHQQESINRVIRYISGSGITWHTHNSARGFAHKGEPLGVGVGTGSNVQSLELAYVDGLTKLGLHFERLVNNEDFYYAAFGESQERKPWVDLSLGVLVDYQWKHFMISSKLQLIKGTNYQWGIWKDTPGFLLGTDLFGYFAQTHLMYFF